MMRQADFTQAMLDAERAVPAGLSAPGGRPAGRRFDVYRNNVAVGLTEALETAFPVLRMLVGDEFFAAMAGVFLRAHPPETPVLMLYGAQMPAFLAGFPPVAHLPYLPDVARLEYALRVAYHAADAAPFSPEALNSLEPVALMQLRFRLAPAVQVIRSEYPVASIWQAHQVSPVKLPAAQPEDALITRPEFDPHVHLLPPGGAAFIEALGRGETLEIAHLTASDQCHNFDIMPVFGLLLSEGAISIQEGDAIK
ncbi:DUF2063 domain-containing protein [Actibacterium sp. XHP0104]|uniref:HvfC/BufC N-terminal domain-containing protein n=1 Tax=Actibacterium sp. XHP0104 TaxID=2984335 RepID=UPI0021E6D802|nr:DNA-binding domain-containing protein [Actibacterium sp. XHP0104]MCV2881285.1 DNA-binding domain-containing protein [Actibacterium sp. XHP0104]